MRLSEIIRSLRPATLAEKSTARLAAVSGGIDVSVPYPFAGWANFADSQYTPASPLAISAGVKTRLTIDGLGAATNTQYSNGMHSDVWSNDTFKPFAVGEAYNIRLTLTVSQESSGTGHFVTFEADIGAEGSPFVAASQSVPLTKGQDVDTLVTISAPFFCLDTFGMNGGRLYLIPSVDVTIHSAAIFIQRTFTP